MIPHHFLKEKFFQYKIVELDLRYDEQRQILVESGGG